MEISQEELNILLDALEARGGVIYPSFKGTDYTYEKLVDKKLLKRTMIRSGYKPKYGYLLTTDGYDVVICAVYRKDKATDDHDTR